MSDQPASTDNRENPTPSPQALTNIKVSLSAGAKFFLLFLVLLVFVFNYWGYLGYPSPDVFANWNQARIDCLNLANANKESLLSDGDQSIKPQSEWIRKGKLVVEIAIRKNDDDSKFSSRLCVVGGGEDEIVPALNDASWE